MSEWEEMTIEGIQWWCSEKGNVLKQGDVYFAQMPKVIQLGPFMSVEEAQEALESPQNKKALSEMLDTFNHSLVDLLNAIRKGR